MKKILIISLVMNVLFGLVGGYYLLKKIPSVITKTPIDTKPHYMDRTTLFEGIPLSEESIVFVGDSITAGNEWVEVFNNPNVKNRGIIGDTTTGLLTRIDSIANYHPKQLFFLYGTNDLQDGTEIQVIVSNYKSIIKKVKEMSPETELFIQSTLPINSTLDHSKRNNKDIKLLNKNLAEMAKESNVTFIDLYSNFVESNELNVAYTHDGLHLSGDGYILWKETVEPYIK